MAIFYGTSGSDTLNGTSVNDTLVYNISQNSAGTQDFYKGGSGIDTVQIEFTREQWLLASNQAQIATYLSQLAAIPNPTTGDAPNNPSSDFTFTFGGATLML